MQVQRLSKKLAAISVSLMTFIGILVLTPSTANAAETQVSDPESAIVKKSVLGSDTQVKGTDNIIREIRPEHENMNPTFTIDFASGDVMAVTQQGNVFEWKDSQGNLIFHIDSPKLPSGRQATLEWNADTRQLVIVPKLGLMPRCAKSRLGSIAANIGWGIGVCMPLGLANVAAGAVCTIGQSIAAEYIPWHNVC